MTFFLDKIKLVLYRYNYLLLHVQTYIFLLKFLLYWLYQNPKKTKIFKNVSN